MQWRNDDPSHPLQLVLDDGRVIGQFYNSMDGKYHLAEYVPYKVPPQRYLCGSTGNFSSSRRDDDRNKCSACWGVVTAYTEGGE